MILAVPEQQWWWSSCMGAMQHTQWEKQRCVSWAELWRGRKVPAPPQPLDRSTWGGVADSRVWTWAGRSQGTGTLPLPAPGACPQVTVGIAFHISMFLFILPPFVCDLFRAGLSPSTCFYSDLHCEALILLEASSHDCNTNDKSSS